MNLDTIIIVLSIAAFPALVVAAAVYQYMEVAKAARWPSAKGRIVTSTSMARTVRSGAGADDMQTRTFAKIEYQFSVAGREYRGSRVGIGEDTGNHQVAETIAKYPPGKEVTVYYNPRRPRECVLERNTPPGLWRGFAVILLVLAGIIAVGVVGYYRIDDLLNAMTRYSPRAPLVAVLVGFAAIFALIVWGLQRGYAQQRTWPTVKGRIERSDVREFEELERRDNKPDRWRTAYRTDVIFSYEVAGVRYTGDMSASGTRISSNIEAVARRSAAKYPVGSEIEVHYNPRNPAEAAVNPTFGWFVLLWLVPIVLLVVAYLVGRYAE